MAGHHRADHRADELRGILRHEGPHATGGGHRGGEIDTVQRGHGGVHRGLVLRDDLGPAARVALGDGVLDLRDRLLLREHAGDGEEAGLEHRVDPSGEPGLAGHPPGIDDVEGDPLGEELLLRLAGQRVPYLRRRDRGVEQEGRPRGRPLQHLGTLDQPGVMAADEAGLVDEVRRPDRIRAEAEVRDRLRAGLLGVVDEVPLGVTPRVLAEDLDGVLVCPDGPVRAHPEEDGAERPRRLDVEGAVVGEAGAAHVIVDADREAGARPLRAQLGEDAGDHRRGQLLGGEPVAAADDDRHGLAGAGGVRLREPAQHVEEERFTERARFLGAVQHGDAAGARRDDREQLGGRERAIEAELHHADLLPLRHEVGRGLRGGLRARSHRDDDALGVGGPVVLGEAVMAPGPLGQRIHRLLDRGGDPRVERVDRLARLEVDVRVLCRAADERPFRRERPATVIADEVGGDKRQQVVVGEQLDRVQLVRGAEAVEEMDEGDPGAERRGLGHHRQVVGLLHGCRGEQRESGLADRHHVGVIAEDRQRLRGQGARRDVEDARGQLAGDLVHVGDHQEQPLRGREGGGQRSTLERPVERPGGTALTLHLHHRGHASPDVLAALAGPLVGQLGHRGRGGDGVDAADLVEPVGGRDRRLVAVDGRAHQPGSPIISMACTGHCSKHVPHPVQRS